MREENRYGLWEKHYFVLVKFGYVLLMAMYFLLSSGSAYRVNALMLALAALCACVMVFYETILRGNWRRWLLAGEFACMLMGMKWVGNGFVVLLPVVVSDAVSLFNLPNYLFSASLVGMLATDDKFTYLMLCLLTCVIYWQHSGIILPYLKSARQYEEQERRLKDSIERSAADFKSESGRHSG